jgi:hypothetical protein
MELERAMRLRPMQKQGDRDDRDMSEREGDKCDLPGREIKQSVERHSNPLKTR